MSHPNLRPDELESETPVALFDMDNSLYAFEEQMRRDLHTLMSPGEPDPWKVLSPNGYIKDLFTAEAEMPWLKARADLIKMRPGWWRDLPRFALGWDIYAMCLKIGFEIEILTKAPHNKPHVAAEKVECIRKDPDLKDCTMHLSERKGRVYGRVLVDDYEPYCLSWLKHRPRGLCIVPAHYYNVDFKHPNVIRYTGTNKDEVENALHAAFHRKDRQHWRDYIHQQDHGLALS